MPPEPVDLLIVGSGVGGLSAAVRAAASHGMRVGVLTKAELAQSATRWAQGGVAAVLDSDVDSADLHLADTLAAGAGLCDLDAVRVMVDEGPRRVNELIALGAVFDTDHEGGLLLAREGGHSMPRIVHAGGAATGAEIERALVDAARETTALLLEHWLALDLIVENGRCRGIVARDADGQRQEVRATHTMLATGGAGQLFAVTTNPTQATGDGIAIALRAGVAVADVEFVQFHPTALHHPAMPRPLLSEALRGHGALVRDLEGERFIDELQPRDVVARAMTERMLRQGADHLWLDATGLERFDERFPTIAASLADVGLDPAHDWLPIAPAAHYCCGGVVTDLDGATSMPGLWACAETACAGIHGANRLASNSLLDGMVFAPRILEAITAGKETAEATGAMRCVLGGWPSRTLARPRPDRGERVSLDAGKAREEIQRTMTEGAGLLRSADSLDRTASALRSYAAISDPEVANLVEVAGALVAAARAREESRGCHTRSDFPDADPGYQLRLVIS